MSVGLNTPSHTVCSFTVLTALHNVAVFSGFVGLTFVYPSLSRTPALSSAALTCSTNVVLNTKEWEKLNEKQSFHLPHESITGAALMKTLHFFPRWSEDRPPDSSSGCLDFHMFISVAKTPW